MPKKLGLYTRREEVACCNIRRCVIQWSPSGFAVRLLRQTDTLHRPFGVTQTHLSTATGAGGGEATWTGAGGGEATWTRGWLRRGMRQVPCDDVASLVWFAVPATEPDAAVPERVWVLV